MKGNIKNMLSSGVKLNNCFKVEGRWLALILLFTIYLNEKKHFIIVLMCSLKTKNKITIY